MASFDEAEGTRVPNPFDDYVPTYKQLNFLANDITSKAGASFVTDETFCTFLNIPYVPPPTLSNNVELVDNDKVQVKSLIITSSPSDGTHYDISMDIEFDVLDASVNGDKVTVARITDPMCYPSKDKSFDIFTRAVLTNHSVQVKTDGTIFITIAGMDGEGIFNIDGTWTSAHSGSLTISATNNEEITGNESVSLSQANLLKKQLVSQSPVCLFNATNIASDYMISVCVPMELNVTKKLWIAAYGDSWIVEKISVDLENIRQQLQITLESDNFQIDAVKYSSIAILFNISSKNSENIIMLVYAFMQ